MGSYKTFFFYFTKFEPQLIADVKTDRNINLRSLIENIAHTFQK